MQLVETDDDMLTPDASHTGLHDSTKALRLSTVAPSSASLTKAADISSRTATALVRISLKICTIYEGCQRIQHDVQSGDDVQHQACTAL